MDANPLVVAFLRENQRRNLSSHTIYDRRRLLTRYTATVDPLTVTSDEINTWLDDDCDIGPRSRSAYLSTLAAFHQWLEDTDHRADDPTRKIRRPKLGRLLPRPIADTDLEHALAHADARMRVWLLLAARDGLRCMEIAQLRREDVVLDSEPPLLIVRQGKGRKDRIVPLNPEVHAALEEYGLRSGYLFTVRSGKPITAGTLSSYVSKFLRSLDIEASLHRGRHKFGTDSYAESGGDLRLVQEMMGHDDPKTTSIYAAFDPVKAAVVVRKLGTRKGSINGVAKGSGGNRPENGDSPVHAPEVTVELEPDAQVDEVVVIGDLPVADTEGGGLDLVPAVAHEKHRFDRRHVRS